MKINYDKEVDILTIKFSDKKIIESDELRQGYIFDFDAKNEVVGLEILNASQRINSPDKMEFKTR